MHHGLSRPFLASHRIKRVTAHGSVNLTTRNMTAHTVTNLRRWSCQDKELPSVAHIKTIHVYDFDNTLFNSPLPNPKLWNGPTLGFLQGIDGFVNGGWWHDPNILGSTGAGIEKEETNAWEGWWNETVVSLVELTMQQKDALSVLLTGRMESRFGELIKRMVASKKLEFDMICLKVDVGPNNQRFHNTMEYKQGLLKDLVHTYTDADEIRVYEDRIKHVRGFRDYFTAFNKTLMSPNAPTPRKPIIAEVVHVAEGSTTLSPVTESAEVQRMVNAHNSSPNSTGRLVIKRTIFYTGYIISAPDTTNLLSLINLPSNFPNNEVKILANNILITPRPCPRSILDKVGGIGKKLTWQVTGTAVFENRIWAARVSPLPASARYYTENPVPMVVLALRKGARPQEASMIQNWQPIPADKAITFETVVGEKVLLRVEEENLNEAEWESFFPHKNGSRKHAREDTEVTDATRGRHQQPQLNINQNSQFPPLPTKQNDHSSQQPNHASSFDTRRGSSNSTHHSRPPNNSRGRVGYRGHQSRGGRGNDRGRGGGGGRGRGRGGGGGYKSLDDVGESSGRGYSYSGQENDRSRSGYGGQGGGLPYSGGY